MATAAPELPPSWHWVKMDWMVGSRNSVLTTLWRNAEQLGLPRLGVNSDDLVRMMWVSKVGLPRDGGELQALIARARTIDALLRGA